MFRSQCAVLLLLSSLNLPLSAADPAFEVASVKAHTGEGETNNRPAEETVRIESGSISMVNVTLVTCMMDAYSIRRFQVSVPDWMNSSRYDVSAKAADPVTPGQMRLMLRTLLAERFRLTSHWEQRNQRVYSLSVARGGHKLRAPAQPGKAMRMADGVIVFRDYSIADLTDALASIPFRIHRPVLDMTGLGGKYDFEVKIAPDELAMKHAFEGMLKGTLKVPLLSI